MPVSGDGTKRLAVKATQEGVVWEIPILDFGIVSDFDIRISYFGLVGGEIPATLP